VQADGLGGRDQLIIHNDIGLVGKFGCSRPGCWSLADREPCGSRHGVRTPLHEKSPRGQRSRPIQLCGSERLIHTHSFSTRERHGTGSTIPPDRRTRGPEGGAARRPAAQEGRGPDPRQGAGAPSLSLLSTAGRTELAVPIACNTPRNWAFSRPKVSGGTIDGCGQTAAVRWRSPPPVPLDALLRQESHTIFA
jgi:hypothetical protein